MMLLIAYSKNSGEVCFTEPTRASTESEAWEHLTKRITATPSTHGALLMERADVEAMLVGLGGIDLLKVVDGALVLDQPKVLAAQTRASKREARKVAKSDAKLEALKTMSAKDWGDLSAAQKWDHVFAFMKATLPDE